MKQILSISLLILLCWQTLFKTGFIIYWKLNQTSIARNLCENKDKPTMHCNGKCFLKKQLNKVDENNNDKKNVPFTVLSQKPMDNFIVENIYRYNVFYSPSLKKDIPALYFSKEVAGFRNSIVHPPEFI